MTSTIKEQLIKLGIELPTPSSPAANYSPFVKVQNLVFISGQITSWGGKLEYRGCLGKEYNVDDGYQAARICGLNILSQLNEACNGDLNRVRQVVKLGGFVNSLPNFEDQPKVINGASDLIASVFGDIGMHCRAAVSTNSLPLGVSVEIDAIFELK